jgi:dienelactone hydrolase
MDRGRAWMAVLATSALVLTAVGSIGTAQADQGRSASRSGSGVVIKDVRIRVPGQSRRVAAYIVEPAGRKVRHADAGILFLHWLGDPHNDRTEYLGEAVGLAEQGVVSVLPQGYFPWVPNPDGTKHDVALVKQQVAAMHRALDRLIHLRGVDPKRIAVVGHDYGAMYASLIADRDHRVSALVLETPDSLWGNWFATYWLGLTGQARTDYYALFDGLNPIGHTSRLGSHVLFQWAGDDVYIPSDVRDAFAAASPKAKVELYDSADHQLTDAARVDRDTFLAHQLHLH